MAHIAARAGLLALSAAALAAAAIIIYENPEVRRYADSVRRRIALALHQLGDGINPQAHRNTPMFNRPEDAYTYFHTQSHHRTHSGQTRGQTRSQSQNQTPNQPPNQSSNQPELGFETDEESRRMQREQLMYWNALHMLKKDQTQPPETGNPVDHKPIVRSPKLGSTFEDFLQVDHSCTESGALVSNTGADVRPQQVGHVYRRAGESALLPGLSLDANPFSDEHRIRDDDHTDEILSVTMPDDEKSAKSDLTGMFSNTLHDNEAISIEGRHATPPQLSPSYLGNELEKNEYMTAGPEEHEQDAFASIQSWAQGSHHISYSPIPMSPTTSLSEHELISEGEATPTDSVSLAGSGEHVTHDTVSLSDDDVISMSEGFATPASWSDVGSVVSEHDHDFR